MKQNNNTNPTIVGSGKKVGIINSEAERGITIVDSTPHIKLSNPYPDEDIYDEETKEQRIQRAIIKEIHEYINGRFTYRDVYLQILVKSCPLSKRCRDYIINEFQD